MRTGQKHRRFNRTGRMEEKLKEAVRSDNMEEVLTILDRLHRIGVSEGFAVEAARRFLNSRGRG